MEAFNMKKVILIVAGIIIFQSNCFYDKNSNFIKRALIGYASAFQSGGPGTIPQNSLNAPSNITAIAVTSSQIYLTWHDNSNDESGFIIERRSGGNFDEITRVSANATSFTDNKVTSGITYYYRIISYNGAGNSNYSNVATATTVASDQTYHYVRSDATGGNNGSDWTNAWTQLPATLTRGHCYYIADGTYPAYTFDDPVSGSVNIVIKKATADDHGTSTGWLASYGDGIATFQPLKFTNSYYILDGQANRGIKIMGGYKGDMINIQSSGLIVRNCELDGNFVYDNTQNYQIQGACTGVNINDSAYVTIENCDIHSIADDGLQIYNCDSIYIKNNVIHNLHSCGTDATLKGPCYNGHSDSLEIFNMRNSEITANFIYDAIETNAALYFSDDANSSDQYCKNITLTNNIFYTPKAGFVVYFDAADGVKVYNNIFWGKQNGRYGGVSIWRVNNLDMYNNIMLSIFYGHMGDLYNSAQHRGDYNLFGHVIAGAGEYQLKSHDLVYANPGFANTDIVNGVTLANPSAADFMLVSGSPCIDSGYAGDANIFIPLMDYSGTIRPQGDGIDRGAYEY
jgi:hypothetical protein